MDSGKSRVTVFDRPTGVICYEATFLRSYFCKQVADRPPFAAFPQRLKYYFPVFSAAKRERLYRLAANALADSVDMTQLEHVCHTLVADDLVWWWQSCPIRDGQTSVFSPPRQWTMLSNDSAHLLIDDISEFDFPTSSGRRIALIGLDRASPTTIEPSWLKRGMHDFCVGETGAVNVVVENPGDSCDDYIFTSHIPAASVKRLLSSLGVDKNAKLSRRRYSSLRNLQLEHLYNL